VAGKNDHALKKTGLVSHQHMTSDKTARKNWAVRMRTI
jgi:hypothetical protein